MAFTSVGERIKARKKIHWLDRKRSAETAKSFNALVPVGTACTYQGLPTYTECPAASNGDWQAAVFVHGVEEPVLLILLDVPGVVMSPKRGSN